MLHQTGRIEKAGNRIYIEPDQRIMPGITHIGRLDFSSAEKPLAPHSHGDSVEFCYLERGVAVFQCGRQKWSIKGGECFISYPEEVHGTGSHPLERMKLYWLGYNPDTLTPWLTESCGREECITFEKAIGTALPRTFAGNRQIGTAINSAIDAYLGNGSMRSIVIKSSLLNLFLHLADKKSNPGIISQEIQQVIKYINASLSESETEKLSLRTCAEITGVSLSRFKARFKMETGIPPAEFITRKKVDKAANLLSEGVSVLDTSIECGFSSSQYFATVFRRYKNTQPSKWAKSQLQTGKIS